MDKQSMNIVSRGTILSTALFTLSLLVVACAGDEILDNYEAFLDRADRSNPNFIDPDAARDKGVLVDITGEHLLNVDLRPIGTVKLRLRASFHTFELQDDGRGFVTGAIRLAEADPAVFTPTSEPLAEFESYIEPDGFMIIDLGRVYVPAELSPIPDTAVDVNLSFKAVVLSEDELCGYIDDPESNVIAPAPLDLVGTTFGSQRWNPDGSQPATVPETCPFPLGLPEPGAGGGGPVDSGSLVAPGIETPFGSFEDISGRFFMRAAVAGSSLVLDFIVDTVLEEHEEAPADCRKIRGGTDTYVRGELRTYTGDDRYSEADPPVGSFCSQIATNGRLDALVEDIVAPSSLGEVNGDISLSVVIVSEDVFCAAAGGFVSRPLVLDLIGTTVGFVRIDEGLWGEPDEPLAACPPVIADAPDAVEDASGEPDDIDGRWFLFINGVPASRESELELRAIADLRTVANEGDDDYMIVDSLVRRYGSEAKQTDPAIGFNTGMEVDEDGQFTFNLNGLLGRLDDGSDVEGNIAIRAWAQDEDTLCGIASARIFRPFKAPFATFTVSGRRLPLDVWGEVEAAPDCP